MSGEGVNSAVIPRACGDDVGDLRSNGPNPLLNRLGDEVVSIIGTDMAPVPLLFYGPGHTDHW